MTLITCLHSPTCKHTFKIEVRKRQCLGSSRHRGFRVSATLVPNFPRLGETVRDWLASSVPQLPGFNGDDLTKLLFPDVQSFTTWTIVGALLVAFVYWEGGIILHELDERRKAQRALEGEEMGRAQPPNRPMTPQQQALYERKQGLAWLAIATAVAMWCTGS